MSKWDQNCVEILDDGRYHGGERALIDIDLIVMHATGGTSAESSMGWLNRPDAPKGSRCSYHYLIDRTGPQLIKRMLPITVVAWGGGDSRWPNPIVHTEKNPKPNKTSVNPHAIHIAWCNDDQGEQLTPDQVGAGEWLCHVLMRRCNLAPSRVRGHYEVAPGRKVDPKPAIDMREWRMLLADNVPATIE